jgi:hypothetical protein
MKYVRNCCLKCHETACCLPKGLMSVPEQPWQSWCIPMYGWFLFPQRLHFEGPNLCPQVRSPRFDVTSCTTQGCCFSDNPHETSVPCPPLFYNPATGNTLCAAARVYVSWMARWLRRYSDSLRAGRPGIESLWRRDFLHLFRPVPRSTQPPIQWVPGLFPGGKAAGAWR